MTFINERIRAKKVRVVDTDGSQLGIHNTRNAVELAKQKGLDLVEISAKAVPPVCKIVDYGKYKYEQSKLKKGSTKTPMRTKEVKFRIGTDEHDYNIKCGRAENFLAAGHKVQVALQFRGRENAHKELGIDMLNRIKDDLAGMSNCDQKPKISGRACRMLLSPLPTDQQTRSFKIVKGDLVEDEEEAEAEEDDILEEEEEELAKNTEEDNSLESLINAEGS